MASETSKFFLILEKQILNWRSKQVKKKQFHPVTLIPELQYHKP